jgi:hypothetical protein
MLLTAVLWAVVISVARTEIPVTVEVPKDKDAAYSIPDPGEDLSLTIKPDDPKHYEMKSSKPGMQDESDAVQWTGPPPDKPQPKDAHVYKIGAVLSSKEYVSIHGELQPKSTGGSGSPSPTPTPIPFDVNVPSVDIDFDGMEKPEDEGKEESEGGIVLVNNDDDNDNQQVDKDETSTVTGENDLKKFIIRKIQPDKKINPAAELKLEVTEGADKIKLWESSEKGSQPVTMPATYKNADLPKTLWVEGVAASTAVRDVSIKASYTFSGGKVAEDIVKITSLPVQFSVTAIADRTGPAFANLTVSGWHLLATATVPNIPGVSNQISCGILRDMQFESTKTVSGPHPLSLDVKTPGFQSGKTSGIYLYDMACSAASVNLSPLPQTMIPATAGAPMVTSDSNSITWRLDKDTPYLGVTQQQFPYTISVSDENHARYFLFVQFGNATPTIVSEVDCSSRNYFSATQTNGLTTDLTQTPSPISWCIPTAGQALEGGPAKNTPVKHDRTGLLDSAASRYLDNYWQ